MLHNAVTSISSYYSDPTFRHVVGATAVLVLAVVVKQVDQIAYVEWPDNEPMNNVLAAIAAAEQKFGLAFDPDDPDLWEQVPGGVRLHGMFRGELV